MTAAPLPLVSEERIADLANDAWLDTLNGSSAIEAAIRTAIKEAGEAAAKDMLLLLETVRSENCACPCCHGRIQWEPHEAGCEFGARMDALLPPIRRRL